VNSGSGTLVDEIDLVAAGSDVIDHDVPVRSPPLAALTDGIALQQRRRKCGPVRHAAGEIGLLRAKPELTNARVDAVGGDDGIGAGAGAIGKSQRDVAGAPVKIDEFLVERYSFGRHA